MSKTLDFLDDFKAEVGKFQHSGLATKNSKQDKIMENNAILKTGMSQNNLHIGK